MILCFPIVILLLEETLKGEIVFWQFNIKKFNFLTLSTHFSDTVGSIK